MKNRTNRKKKGFDYIAYLKEIERHLPKQKDQNRRQAMVAARDYLLENFPERSPRQTLNNLLSLDQIIHCLQCCGVSPKGCPPPIKPHKGDRFVMIPLFGDKIHGSNGGAAL